MLSTAGADRVVSVDLHSGQIQGFFDVPFDHLTAAPVLEGYLKSEQAGDIVVVAPDAGRVKVASATASTWVRTSPWCTRCAPKARPTRSRPSRSSATSRGATAWSSTT